MSVSNVPTAWWAFKDGKFQPLGICADFDEADERCPDAIWLVNRQELVELQADIAAELGA